MSWRPANGLRSWLIQRISAVYLAVYLIAAVIAMSICFPATYSQWRSWMAYPVVNVATTLFLISLMIHAWVGIRDVVLDYVHPLMMRFVFLALIGTSLLYMGIWSIHILFSVVYQ